MLSNFTLWARRAEARAFDLLYEITTSSLFAFSFILIKGMGELYLQTKRGVKYITD
jgi:hypothetical protein